MAFMKTKTVSLLLALAMFATPFAIAETCSTAQEMDAATKSAIQSAASAVFPLVANGDAQGVAARAIPDIANNVAAVQGLLDEHKQNLAGSSATPRNTFLLEAGGNQVLERAEFFCGVFNSPAKTGFTMANLPPGKYGLVIMEVTNSKSPYFYSFLLLEQGGQWKVAGLFPRNRQVVGKDHVFYWQQARDLKSKGQNINAWLHYLIAREIAAPLPFIGTTKLDQFYDEVQQALPPDMPAEGKPMTISAGGKTYQVTQLFVVPNEKDKQLDLVMKYSVPDVSDQGKIFLENKEAMKALLSRYPELRSPFANVVARAVAPNGQDFGSMMPTKDIQ